MSFGWFLDSKRALECLRLLPPSQDFQFYPPSLGLLNALYLLGIHVSDCEELHAHESVFLARAKHHSMTFRNPVQDIQAHLLLAHYFLLEGRFTEAMHSLDTSMSLAIALRKAADSGGHPFDQTELTDAIYAVVSLHKTWSIALQWPPSFLEVSIPTAMAKSAHENVSTFFLHCFSFAST